VTCPDCGADDLVATVELDVTLEDGFELVPGGDGIGGVVIAALDPEDFRARVECDNCGLQLGDDLEVQVLDQ
jgi:transcription elongation factor Elf1